MNSLPPFEDSTDSIGCPSELSRRLKESGYLFLRGLLPEAPLLDVREGFTGVLDAAGWLRNGFPVGEAVAEPSAACGDPDPKFQGVLGAIYKLEEFHALQHHPIILRLLEQILAGPVVAHPRISMRIVFPQRGDLVTRAHQDHPAIQGTEETYTV